ncbi:hypothetical protein [Bacillus infantis]
MQKNEKALNIMLQPGVAGQLLLHKGMYTPNNQACKMILITVKYS